MNQQKEQNPQDRQKNKEILSTCLVIGAIVLAIVLIVGGSYISPLFEDMVNYFKSYDEYIEKVNYIDEEKDIVVLTYPSFVFHDEEELNNSVETLKGTEGTKKVIINEDGSLTAVMNIERYEKIREAAKYAALSLPYMMINEETAIRDVKYNEDYSYVELTVNRSAETVEKELSDIIYMVSFYHICNMDNEKTIEVSLIDYETGENYLTQLYNTQREVVEKQ